MDRKRKSDSTEDIAAMKKVSCINKEMI